ncbi:hypothetical protein L9F63_006567, partial [Diploptera punctata]
WYFFLRCTSCERSLNYATKMARMLQSSTGRIGKSPFAFAGQESLRRITKVDDLTSLFGDMISFNLLLVI